jgi:hypothetical protein
VEVPIHFQRAYGLSIATNQIIPGLQVLRHLHGRPDVEIWLKHGSAGGLNPDSPSQAFYVSRAKDDAGIPLLRAASLADSKRISFLYSDGAQFVFERDGSEIVAEWPGHLTLEDVAPYLVGPVLGIVLRLKGIVSLHASAIVVGDRAIAFVGPAGAGKSTTAAAFAKRGYRVISDDVVALMEQEDRFVIPPGYPRVNLCTDSIRAICGDGSELPLVSRSWDKHFLALDSANEFETRSLSLGGIYSLRKREPELTAPAVERLTGTEAMLALLGNTYMNYLPDAEGRRREFELLGRVVSKVPVKSVCSAGFSMLPQLCQTIEADVAGTTFPSALIREDDTNAGTS